MDSALAGAAVAQDEDSEPACKKVKLDQPESDGSTTPNKICDHDASRVTELDKPEDTSRGPMEGVTEALLSNPSAANSDNSESALEDKKDSDSAEIGMVEKQTSLTEVEAGITQYLGDHEGFNAIIKQRYSDFIVNEVDVDGKVVYLTDLNPPEFKDDEETDEDKKDEETSDVISAEDLMKVKNLVDTKDKVASVNIVAPDDKALRTKIHLTIKKQFTQLETKTTEVDGVKMIQVVWRTGRSRDSQRDEWPKSKKSCRYVKFVLYKENKDTMDAIGLIAKQLKIKENLFQYAGTKDKRAKTSQHITAHRVHPKKLSCLNKTLWNMGIGNFQFVNEPLKLGQLSGNHFTIVLRNVQGSTETVDHAMSSLKSKGFINYFGMQRFGTTSVPTHKVGSALLHGDWEKAVDLILMPRDDNPSKDTFQRIWMETKDPDATLKVTPRYCGLERNLLEALKKKMKPFNALEKISRNTRLLYIHSYQALVWNQMVSKRITQMGLKPVVGDLVLAVDSEKTERPVPTVITSENISQYKLHDVVLPLPGHDVVYPKNEVHQWYKETLAADGLNIDNMKRQQKDYSLPGAYRHITVWPSDVTWSHHRYDDYTLPITLSDLDRIKEESLPESHNKGKYKALLLKMTLPPSCYATMALREVLRTDTSVAHQTSLNVT